MALKTSTPDTEISLGNAILININVMLGTGMFINTTELAKRSGSWGSISYLTVGILLLPLILCISELLKRYPAGGFYSFGKPLHPFAGFISSWTYFTAKLASASLMIHTAVVLIQTIIPAIQHIPTLWLDSILITIFTCLNLYNIKTGTSIQTAFVVGKIIPLIFLTLSACILFDYHLIFATTHSWHTITSTLPLVLYATIGFEAACSLSSRIKNAKVNAPKALLLSYGIAITILSLYQLMFYGILGSSLETIGNFTKPFPALIGHLPAITPLLQTKIITILHLAIACSALGGSYGILFSNSWNLYTLASYKHTFLANNLTNLNRYQTPWLCVLIEGMCCMIYLISTGGHQITLQQISALGCIMAYTISVLALILLAKKESNASMQWLALFGLLNCIALTANCLYSLASNSSYSLVAFSILLIAGSSMFISTYKKSV